MQIKITKDVADAILKLNERYFFDMFKPICTNEDEEYQLRDALAELAKQI